MPSDVHPKEACADVGILCVHGIGVQVDGETLRNAAGPLFQQWERDGARVEYGETILKPRQQLDNGPARISATVTLDSGDDLQRRRLLMAESRWADVFDAPSYSQLLGWLMSHGTWIAIRHAAFSISAPLRFFERRADRKKKQRSDFLGFADSMLAYLGAIVSVFVVALPLQSFLLAVWALAILPFKWTKDLAQRVALGVSAVLGDASVYSADATLRNAILTRVRKDLEWVKSRVQESGPIIILAHSQGAAVVYDLLSSMTDLSRIRLVTYGEGIRKLTELELGARQRPLIISVCAWLWAFAIVALVVIRFAVIFIVGAVTTGGAGPISTRVGTLLLFYVFAFLLLSTSIYHIARSRETEVDAPITAGVAALLAKKLTWVDLYASSDPVPRGRLLGNTPLTKSAGGWKTVDERDSNTSRFVGFRSRRVVNQLSTLADHTSYWQTPNDFVPIVASTIKSWIGLDAALTLPAGRSWRIRLRKAAGIALAALGMATFWRAGDPLRDRLWSPAWNLLPIEPTSFSAQIVTRYQLRDPGIALAGLLAFLLVAYGYSRFILDPAWNALEQSVWGRPPKGGPIQPSWWGALGYRARRLAPVLRATACVAAIGVPISLLAGVIAHGNYAPLLESVTSIADWGRTLAGLGLAVLVYGGLFMAVVGGGVWVYEWWTRGQRAQ